MIDVFKQMVEALEWCHGGEPIGTAEAIQAGKQAIAELESQEPVGRFAKFTDGIWRPVTDYSAGVPLYTYPPQHTWVGLAKEDRLTAKYMQDAPDGIEAVIDYIEAKLKQKNGYAEEKNT